MNLPSHPRPATLPGWPGQTVGVLVTVDSGPHAIPVSAPVRGGDRLILISLRNDRGSLSRLEADPRVALLVLAPENVAFTARGRARLLEGPMAADPDYAALAIDVEEIDDHRQEAFRVTGGADREWIDPDEQSALKQRVGALRAMAESAASDR